jgi:hypothetical protein
MMKKKEEKRRACGWDMKDLRAYIYIYRAVNDGGDKDGPEPAEEGVGGEGSKYGEEIRDADPSVHNLHRHGGGLVEFICEVREEVASQPTESKSLRHFNDCKHIIIKRSKETIYIYIYIERERERERERDV